MKGFNLGTLFHAAQIQWRQNGHVPSSFVQRLKAVTPTDMWQVCRNTGTQSNMMLLDRPGYNNTQLTQQLSNQRIPQPTISYWTPFVQFYRDGGFQGAAITVNSHNSYVNQRTDFERIKTDVLDLIAFLIRSNVNIVSIELENEGYLYPSITVITNGSPNLWERMRHGNNIERIILDSCLRWQEHLKNVANAIRNEMKVPIGVSVGNPTTMRDRNYNAAVLQDQYYDFVAPHIYVTSSTSEGIAEAVRQHITPLPTHISKRVTEFNWNYNSRPEGHTVNNDTFLGYFEQAFKMYGVNDYFYHTLWNRQDANGWAQNLRP